MIRAITFAFALTLAYGCQVQQFTPVVSPTDQGEIGGHLLDLRASLQAARKSAQDATQASSLAALKHYIDEVFAAVWGHGSELTSGSGVVWQLVGVNDGKPARHTLTQRIRAAATYRYLSFASSGR